MGWPISPSLLVETVLAIHEAQIAAHGGMGLRDPGLLESALAQPRNRMMHDGKADRARLAADYAFGIVRNHPFLDGNKRVAFVCMQLFLALNGLRLTASDVEALRTMLALAAGEIDEVALALWIETHTAAL